MSCTCCLRGSRRVVAVLLGVVVVRGVVLVVVDLVSWCYCCLLGVFMSC